MAGCRVVDQEFQGLDVREEVEKTYKSAWERYWHFRDLVSFLCDEITEISIDIRRGMVTGYLRKLDRE